MINPWICDDMNLTERVIRRLEGTPATNSQLADFMRLTPRKTRTLMKHRIMQPCKSRLITASDEFINEFGEKDWLYTLAIFNIKPTYRKPSINQAPQIRCCGLRTEKHRHSFEKARKERVKLITSGNYCLAAEKRIMEKHQPYAGSDCDVKY